jgi:hypothetical protein
MKERPDFAPSRKEVLIGLVPILVILAVIAVTQLLDL